ncbi:hypothetical protein HDU97_007096 [Phlyctochytrium planicorne]|nr:hypothetical protein HDU97_007096 [Phlyctochytrium planicorne]
MGVGREGVDWFGNFSMVSALPSSSGSGVGLSGGGSFGGVEVGMVANGFDVGSHRGVEVDVENGSSYGIDVQNTSSRGVDFPNTSSRGVDIQNTSSRGVDVDVNARTHSDDRMDVDLVTKQREQAMSPISLTVTDHDEEKQISTIQTKPIAPPRRCLPPPVTSPGSEEGGVWVRRPSQTTAAAAVSPLSVGNPKEVASSDYIFIPNAPSPRSNSKPSSGSIAYLGPPVKRHAHTVRLPDRNASLHWREGGAVLGDPAPVREEREGDWRMSGISSLVGLYRGGSVSVSVRAESRIDGSILDGNSSVGAERGSEVGDWVDERVDGIMSAPVLGRSLTVLPVLQENGFGMGGDVGGKLALPHQGEATWSMVVEPPSPVSTVPVVVAGSAPPVLGPLGTSVAAAGKEEVVVVEEDPGRTGRKRVGSTGFRRKRWEEPGVAVSLRGYGEEVY